MKTSRLGLHLTGPLVLIASLAVALNAGLNYARFERTLTQVEAGRMRVVVNDIASTLETGTRLGLPIQGLSNAHATLSTQLDKDKSILSVSVFDEAGVKAFHAGQQLASTTLPAHWLAPGMKKGKEWSSEQADGFAVATPLTTSIGNESGWVVLRYQRQSHDQIMQSVAEALTPIALAGTLVTALLGWLGVHFLVKLLERKMHRAARALQSPDTLTDVNSQAIALAHGASSKANEALRAIREQISQVKPNP
jgi:hypothetical protein